MPFASATSATQRLVTARISSTAWLPPSAFGAPAGVSYSAMTHFGPRYAIYFAPAPESSLWRFGSATIGYNAASGRDIPATPPVGYEHAVWDRLTEEPRRYGFHATLKA